MKRRSRSKRLPRLLRLIKRRLRKRSRSNLLMKRLPRKPFRRKLQFLRKLKKLILFIMLRFFWGY